jgi:hypothetical protein
MYKQKTCHAQKLGTTGYRTIACDYFEEGAAALDVLLKVTFSPYTGIFTPSRV